MKTQKTSKGRKVLERPLPENETTDRGEIKNKNRMKEARDAELTGEDFDALGTPNLSDDTGEDEPLKQRTHAVDFAAEDLDVPGAELDDAQEDIGAEDEENNPYSLGGDRHGD